MKIGCVALEGCVALGSLLAPSCRDAAALRIADASHVPAVLANSRLFSVERGNRDITLLIINR